jgi:ABC-type bacteriocin/lantibiotic exporter with double-glycine peptidase domain
LITTTDYPTGKLPTADSKICAPLRNTVTDLISDLKGLSLTSCDFAKMGRQIKNTSKDNFFMVQCENLTKRYVQFNFSEKKLARINFQSKIYLKALPHFFPFD